ncbi:uncharacterized protein LOC134458079 [Engraulis encrasicolus]|uniref:uncharacterized protein LOC134458079 n=1 Tax=Engraulis encrasicolus TaxID=184585 RepID=UPI002FD52FD7
MHCAFFGLNHHLSVTTWLLCIGCAAVASSLRVTAVEGRTVLINCFPTTDTSVRDTDSDTDTDSTDQASSALYLCKGHSRYTCQDVLRVEGSHVRRADERFLLKPAAGVPLVVLITDAQLSDSGTYWCGLHRSKRFTEYEEIHLYVAPKTDRSDTTSITATPAVAKQQQTTSAPSVTTGLPINIILSLLVVAAFVLGVIFLVLHRNLGKHKAGELTTTSASRKRKVQQCHKAMIWQTVSHTT